VEGSGAEPIGRIANWSTAEALCPMRHAVLGGERVLGNALRYALGAMRRWSGRRSGGDWSICQLVNWGNALRLAPCAERERAGGSGQGTQSAQRMARSAECQEEDPTLCAMRLARTVRAWPYGYVRLAAL